MGAIEMGLTEEEPVLVMLGEKPAITMLWWDIDSCVKETVKRIRNSRHTIYVQEWLSFIVLPAEDLHM